MINDMAFEYDILQWLTMMYYLMVCAVCVCNDWMSCS